MSAIFTHFLLTFFHFRPFSVSFSLFSLFFIFFAFHAYYVIYLGVVAHGHAVSFHRLSIAFPKVCSVSFSALPSSDLIWPSPSSLPHPRHIRTSIIAFSFHASSLFPFQIHSSPFHSRRSILPSHAIHAPRPSPCLPLSLCPIRPSHPRCLFRACSVPLPVSGAIVKLK